MPPGGREGGGEDEGEGGSVLGVQSVATSSDGSGGGGGGGMMMGVGNGGLGGGVGGGGMAPMGGGETPIGFAAIIATEGHVGREATTVGAKLAWQREVKGEDTKTKSFAEQVLVKQQFQAFAFMKPGSPWVQMGHGIGKFFAYTNTVPELEGKVLMFVGDRGKNRDPGLVQPPVQTTWKWVTANVVMDTAALAAFHQANGGGVYGNRGQGMEWEWMSRSLISWRYPSC
jgi:hypothetical protein